MITHEAWFRSSSAAEEFFDLIRNLSPSSTGSDIDRMWELAYRLKQFPEIDWAYYNKRLQTMEAEANSRSSAKSLSELWWLARHMNTLPKVTKTALYNSPKRSLPYYPVFRTLSVHPGSAPLGYLVQEEIHMLENGEFPEQAVTEASTQMRLDDLVREINGDWKVMKDHGSGDLFIFKTAELPGQHGEKVPISVVLNIPLELKESPAFQNWL